MTEKKAEPKKMDVYDEIRQLKFEISVLHKGFHNMQEKIGELEMFIMGEKAFGNKELQ